MDTDALAVMVGVEADLVVQTVNARAEVDPGQWNGVAVCPRIDRRLMAARASRRGPVVASHDGGDNFCGVDFVPPKSYRLL